MTAIANRVNSGNKPQRVPVSGLRDILTVYGKDEGYIYRWVVDADERGGRIMKFQRGGYEFVTASSVDIGAEAVYKSKQDGSLVRLPTGGGKYSYLMRIKKEWYNEDQDAAQKSIDETEAAMVQASKEADDSGQYGTVKITRD